MTRLTDWFTRTVPFTARTVVYLLAHVVIFLIGLVLVIAGGTGRIAVGTSLMGAAIAGWVMFSYIVVSDRWTRRLEVLSEFGIKDAFAARSVRIRAVYDQRLAAAERNIDALGFGQRALRQDHAQDFEAWGRRTMVRILLLDPEFISTGALLADQRDAEEGERPGTISGDVNDFLVSVRPAVERSSGRFQVRLYRCLPTVNIFRIDDDLFWGPYLVREQSRNSPTFHVGRGGLLFDRLLRHFEAIWSDSELSRSPFD